MSATTETAIEDSSTFGGPSQPGVARSPQNAQIRWDWLNYSMTLSRGRHAASASASASSNVEGRRPGCEPTNGKRARQAGRSELDRAADVVEALGAAKVAVIHGARALADGVRNGQRMVHAVRDLPRLTIPVGDSLEYREIQAAYCKRRWGIPLDLAVGVLVLPGERSAYMKGRRRHALRTNCSHARAAGMWYVTASDAVDLERRVAAVAGSRPERTYGQFLQRRVARGNGEFRFVDDTEKGPVALAVVTVAGEVAQLNWMLGRGTERSYARHLLSAELIGELIGRGVKYLLSDSVLFMTPGDRHFQRLLGYEPYNLVFVDGCNDAGAIRCPSVHRRGTALP